MAKPTLALFLFATSFIYATGQCVSLPFQSEGGLILVHVTVNGQDSVMIVDTGSKVTFVNDPNSRNELRSNANFALHIRQDAANIVVADSRTDLTAAYISTAALSKQIGHKVDGILGADFLSSFKRMSINYRDRVIILGVQ